MSDMTFRVDLQGDREIAKALGMMNQRMHKKVLRGAFQSALRPALNEVRREAPVESGALRDSYKIRIKAYPPFVFVGKVWPDKKFVIGFIPGSGLAGHERRPINYAHLVEGGHRIVTGGSAARRGKKRDRKKHKGTISGWVPPNPFVRRAWATTKQEQIRRFRKAFLRGARREWETATKGTKAKRRLS